MYGGEPIRFVGICAGWHTVPVNPVSVPAELRPPMLYKFLDGSFQIIRTGFGFTLWTVRLPALGDSNESGDPQHEDRIEGHKLGVVRVMARLGRTTSDQQ